MVTSPNPTLSPWAMDDLHKSGLSLEHFPIEPLSSWDELKDRLGYTSINGTRILEVGGYWINYPNKPDNYRLKLREPINDIKYLSKKGGGNYPYIPSQLESYLHEYSPDKAVFITEGEKKAAKATIEGFLSLSLSGVWNFKNKENDFLADLNKLIWKDRTAYITFDSDISKKHSVKQAEIRLAIELINRGAKVFSVRLPNEPDGTKNGLDDFLVRYGNEAFKELVLKARPTLDLHVEDKTDFNLILRELHHLDNEVVRVKTIKALAFREGANMEAMEAEYKKYLPEDKSEKKSEKEVFTPEQLDKARTLLDSPDILGSMIDFTKRQGFIGEEDNQKLIYLSSTSRFFLKDTISAIVKGQSASGKSHLVGTVHNLIPQTDIINLSFITAKALVHRQGDLNHKILYIAEHTGGEGADYSIRTALSEGEISIMIPEKDEVSGKWETVEKRIPAKGLVFIETTTSSKVHHENQTRLFDLYTDESEGQTAKILLAQAAQIESQKPELVAEAKEWRAAQTLLKNHRVYIPYAKEIAKTFPKTKTRARRDFPRLLSLVRAHTLLYQFQRKIDQDGRLIAEVKDLEAIIILAEPVLSQSIKELSPKQEEAVLRLQKEFSGKEFSTKDAHEKTKDLAKYSTLQTWLKEFTKDGILEWNDRKGTASRYTLLAPDRLLGNTHVFSSNLLESLKINYLEPDLGNTRQLGNPGIQLPNNLELPSFKNEVIESNDNGELCEKKVITQLPIKGLNGGMPGSTEPDDFAESDNGIELPPPPWEDA